MKTLLFTLTFVLFLMISVSSRLTAAPTITAVSATPNIIPSNASTGVTITAKITDASLIPTSVNLLQITSTGTTILGQLHDDGNNGDVVAGDHIYTSVQNFNLPVGQIQLQVSAAFTGMLRRVLSLQIPVVTLITPPTFTVNPGPLSVGGPLALNNFGSNYQQGAAIPQNGAEIDVTSMPLPPPPFSDFVALELQGSTTTSTSTVTVSGVSCTQVFYTDSYTATVTYNNEVVYCPSGTTLYKFYLSYNAGDPNTSQYLSSFQQFLSNAKLTP